MSQRFVSFLLTFCAFACLAASLSHAQTVSLELDGIDSPSFRTGKLAVALSNPFGAGTAKIAIAQAKLFGKDYAALTLTCASFRQEPDWLRCNDGVLTGLLPEPMPLDIAFNGKTKAVDLVLKPADKDGLRERWQITIDRLGNVYAMLENARLVRLSEWLPLFSNAFFDDNDPFRPKPTGGRVSGVVKRDAQQFSADVKLLNASFADQSGLRAGEKISATLQGTARNDNGTWTWQGGFDWQAGEVFWQPMYVAVPKGGHQLSARGTLDAKAWVVSESTLKMAEVGSATITAELARSAKAASAATTVTAFNAVSKRVDLTALATYIPKVWLEAAHFDDLVTKGSAEFNVAMRNDAWTEFDVRFTDVLFDAPTRKSGIFGLNAHIPWRAGQTSEASIRWQGGLIHSIPIGVVDTQVALLKDGDGLTIPNLVIPVLDGIIGLADIRARRLNGEWQAELQGAVTPISMQRLSESQGWPKLGGTLHGNIPRIVYAKSALRFEGALEFELFDGKARATGIRIEDLTSKVPSFFGDLSVRGMDLTLLTQAFSFGNITGKIDVDVKGLELESWQPIAFDARVITSEGNFAKRISQKAVQNISSVGGRGAGAAIQASVLRVFETFGYEKIGLSCRLRSNICDMGGVESAPNGYVMVKGGGIPSLTVVGYNRQVGWLELMDRVKQATEGKLKAEIR